MSKTFKTVNPFTMETRREYFYHQNDQVLEVLNKSYSEYLVWREDTLGLRVSFLRALKDQIEQERENLALTMTQEMGKPIAQSYAEVDKCLGLIDYCVEVAHQFLEPEKRQGYTVYREPLGIVYGIMPWNFPLWQTLRFALPVLLAGNVVILKPADSTAGTALLLQQCFDQAYKARKVFTTLTVTHEVSEQIIGHSFVRGVSLTGSTRAGKIVARQCGEQLKKMVMELGGNDAYLICQDADMELAVEKVYFARTLNTGQSCISAKRIFVHQDQERDFLERLVGKIKNIQYVDPAHQDAVVGPLARVDLAKQLKDQVVQLCREGAEIFYEHQADLLQKMSPCFVPVTVLRGFSKTSHVHSEELFGPIFSVITYSDEQEALQLINSSPFGLGGAVFSRDIKKAQSLARKMETGTVAMNDFFRSTYEKPFGGIKQSGFGRELGPEGFIEFANLKVLVDAP